MFDRATCATMRMAEHPSVGLKHLQELKQLLKLAAKASPQTVIENQHLGSLYKGDADEKRTKSQLHSTEPIPTTSGHPDLAEPPSASAAESPDPFASTAARGSQRSTLLSEKGGAQ